MEEFKNRLLEFIELQYGASQREFEKMCDLGQGTISSIKKQGPTTDTLLKISNRCPELNLNWLIAGRGEMLMPSPVSPSNPSEARYIAHLEEEIEVIRKEKDELWQLVQKFMK